MPGTNDSAHFPEWFFKLVPLLGGRRNPSIYNMLISGQSESHRSKAPKQAQNQNRTQVVSFPVWSPPPPPPPPPPSAAVELPLPSVFLRGKRLISLESLCYIVGHILTSWFLSFFFFCLCLICLTFRGKINTSRLGSQSSHHRTNAGSAQVKSCKAEALSCSKCFSLKKLLSSHGLHHSDQQAGFPRQLGEGSESLWQVHPSHGVEAMGGTIDCLPNTRSGRHGHCGLAVFCSPRADVLEDWTPLRCY